VQRFGGQRQRGQIVANNGFVAPGPGQWGIDRSHISGGATPVAIELMTAPAERGMRKMFAELGAPLDTLRAQYIRGFGYFRLIPLIGANKPAAKLPPLPVLKLASKLHPAFRSRAKTAAVTLRDRPWLAMVQRWEREVKPELVAKNQTFQSVDVHAIDEAALVKHLAALEAHARSTVELHFWLHGYDLIPLALYLRECDRWKIAPSEAVKALGGASPSTSAPRDQLFAMRQLIDAAGAHPTSLADVRAVSPDAKRLLDDYLADHGSRVVGYDIVDLTLNELGGNVLSSILDARAHTKIDVSSVAAALRAKVGAEGRDDFEQAYADARLVMNIRDENGPNTVQWPLGLIRSAMLAAGKRLAARSRLLDAEHALELGFDELSAMLTTGDGPSAAQVAQRSTDRLADSELDPPTTLGPVEAVPPSSVLPGPLRTLVEAIEIVMSQMDLQGAADGELLVGSGIGTTVYRGRVRRAADAHDAIHCLEPGEVLVVRATSSAFNTVLTCAGALVTANGGPLSHAAVIARELGIPAVVGARGACDLPDGTLVEVDPIRGRVTVISTP
jgi:rifampicin phosphotransferase